MITESLPRERTGPPILLLDRGEASEALRISTRKLDELIERGSIVPTRIDGRVLVAWKELQDFVARNTVPQAT